MRRITRLLVLLLASTAGCEQALGLDDYKQEGEGGGDDATLVSSPEGAADTAPADRTTGGDVPRGDATTPVDESGGDAPWDSIAADGADAAPGPSSDAAESDEADASEGTDSDAGSPDVDDSAEAGAEADSSDGPAMTGDSAPSGSGCPQVTPPGAMRCCAHVPCVDRSGNDCNCGECMQAGCPGICCFDSQGNMSCASTPADCR